MSAFDHAFKVTKDKIAHVLDAPSAKERVSRIKMALFYLNEIQEKVLLLEHSYYQLIENSTEASKMLLADKTLIRQLNVLVGTASEMLEKKWDQIRSDKNESESEDNEPDDESDDEPATDDFDIGYIEPDASPAEGRCAKCGICL